MSIQSVLTRIDQLEAAFAPPPPRPAGQQTGAASATSFSDVLQQASAGAPGAALGVAGVSTAGGSLGQRIVAIAEGEVGQAEQPPGSNESPRIAQYRSATAGAIAGAPWCAYFASWVAHQAGAPVGDSGQGFGAVDGLWAWAQRTGKSLQPGQQPQAGDLIVFNEHIGIVEKVLPNGSLQTIEGNYADKVSRNVRSPSEAIGYVHLG